MTRMNYKNKNNACFERVVWKKKGLKVMADIYKGCLKIGVANIVCLSRVKISKPKKTSKLVY